MFRKFVLWSQTNKDKSTEIFPPLLLKPHFLPLWETLWSPDKQVKERTTFLCCIALALKAIAARKRTVQKHYICIILCNALSFRSENLEQRKSIFVSRKCDILMTTFVCLFTLQCKKAGRSFCFTASTWPIEEEEEEEDIFISSSALLPRKGFMKTTFICFFAVCWIKMVLSWRAGLSPLWQDGGWGSSAGQRPESQTLAQSTKKWGQNSGGLLRAYT